MKKGFTLVELILVLAIISIIAIMAVPNSRVFLDIREMQELKELRKDLLFARNKAILESRNYFIYLEPSRNTYIIKTSETSPAIKTKKFKYGITISDKNSIKVLQFNPSGSPGQSGTISFRDRHNNRYDISVTPSTGRIELKYEGK